MADQRREVVLFERHRRPGADHGAAEVAPENSPKNSIAGTKGLGLFLLPRRLDDGSPNGIYIRRLKDKLGTKSLATAEVDFRTQSPIRSANPVADFSTRWIS